MKLLDAVAGRSGKLSKPGKLAITRAAQDQLLFEIQDIESRAHALGMHVTGHALNRAKNALGWEIAGEVEEAGKAAFRGGQG